MVQWGYETEVQLVFGDILEGSLFSLLSDDYDILGCGMFDTRAVNRKPI